MTFQDYYLNHFKADLSQFFESIPEESKFHEDSENRKIYSIQLETLTSKKGHINFLPESKRNYFAHALFYTVLVDMVAYTHFKFNYDEFQALTNYPKLIGNCMHLCKTHYNPIEIFNQMQIKNGAHDSAYETINAFMKEQTFHFFKNHMPQLDAEQFWQMCERYQRAAFKLN